MKLRLPARLLSQVARFITGVDIHPGALLGRRLFIDHATGVVIGETAIVGSDVTLYQGVTLGGTGKGHGKRHPTLCDGVFVGNNANVLGNITIGQNSRVGAGSVVLNDVPPNSTVVGVPAHIVYRNGQRVLVTDPHDVKDPLSDALIALAARVEELEAEARRRPASSSRSRQKKPSAPPTARSSINYPNTSPWAKVFDSNPVLPWRSTHHHRHSNADLDFVPEGGASFHGSWEAGQDHS